MRIVIVDDEKISQDRLNNLLLKKYGDFIDSIEIFSDPVQFANSSVEFDLLFLDIEMPGMTGIELSQIKKLENACIVFVTSKESMVFEAYNQTNALGFVRKQQLENDLTSIMDKLTEKERFGYLTIEKGKGAVKVAYSDILYIENVHNDIIIHTAHSTLDKRYSLSKLEKDLEGSDFFRCHQSFIVNLNYIEFINYTGVTLTDQSVIPISRTKYKDLKSEFLKFNGA